MYSDVILLSNYSLTIPTLIVTTLISVLYQKITDYISLLGSFCSVIIALFVPGMIYIKGNGLPLSHWRNISTIILVTFLSGIGFTSGVFTIMGIIDKLR